MVIVLFLMAGGFAAAQNAGGVKYVAVKSAAVKSSAGFFSSVRGYLPEGEAVTVLREQNRWVEIRSSTNVSGWVSSGSLTTKRVIATGRQYSVREVAMAGKGFSVEIEAEYRQATQVDYSFIDSMEAMRVPPENLLNFLNEGHLARGE